MATESLLLLINRVEHYNHYNSAVYEAEIELNYQILMPRRLRSSITHSFVASYRASCTGGDLALTGPLHSEGAVFLDPSDIRGSRVGTYLMNEIVGWAKQWPEADVRPISLLTHQAGNGEAFHTERRNQFYEQFKIEFDYADVTKAAGVSKPMKALALAQVNTWKENITEIEVYDYVAQLLNEAETAAITLADCTRTKDNWARLYKWAEDNPARWFGRTLLNKCAGLLGLAATLLVVAAVGYKTFIDLYFLTA